MITSGVGLGEERLAGLVDAGLEHLQLSFQDLDETTANHIAGTRAHALKLALIPVLKKFPLAFTVNLVVHRMNLDRLEAFIALAEDFAPDRLEIAHVQYYGWALKNRSLLMPTQEQVDRSLPIIEAAKERLKGRIHLEAVFPDYFGSFPKACVGGWGRQMMLIDPLARRCRAMQRRSFPVCTSITCATMISHGYGNLPRPLIAFEGMAGCRIPASPVRARSATSEVAAARRSCLPGMPRPSIRFVNTARITSCSNFCACLPRTRFPCGEGNGEWPRPNETCVCLSWPLRRDRRMGGAISDSVMPLWPI